MNLIIKIFLIFSLFLLQNLFAQTRQQVIEDATNYKNYSWQIGANNILDIQKHISDDGNIYIYIKVPGL